MNARTICLRSVPKGRVLGCWTPPSCSEEWSGGDAELFGASFRALSNRLLARGGERLRHLFLLRGHRNFRDRTQSTRVADEFLGRSWFKDQPDNKGQREQRTQNLQDRKAQEVSVGEDNNRQAANAEHLDLRNDIGRRVHVTSGDGESRVADEKRRIKDHEILELKFDDRGEQREQTGEDKYRYRRGDHVFRDKAKKSGSCSRRRSPAETTAGRCSRYRGWIRCK